jgi:hypothetical protein
MGRPENLLDHFGCNMLLLEQKNIVIDYLQLFFQFFLENRYFRVAEHTFTS